MIWPSLVFNYLGLVAFAAALESHRRTFPRAASRIRPARLFALGGVSQAIALALALCTFQVSLGLVLWAVGWAVCGLILSLVLASRPGSWPLPAVIFSLISVADWLGLV